MTPTREQLELEKLGVEIELLKKSLESREGQKLDLEIDALKKEKRRSWITFVMQMTQGFVVILGIFFAYKEFVLKDRESINLKTKLTLEYVQKIGDSAVVMASNMLQVYRDSAYGLPVTDGDSTEIAFFSNLADRFPQKTFALAHFYNTLESGISSGYFDKEICFAFLSNDVSNSVSILSELQSRHYGLESKIPKPDYRRFKGMIDFYIACNKGNAIDPKSVPQYDINKPYSK